MKPRFILLSIKKNILPALFCLFALSLVIFSKGNLKAAKDGLNLWATAVVPSLLPFFIATELLSHTNIVHTLGKYFRKIMHPLFHISGEGSYPLIMGMMSGYPVGAKIVTDFRNQNICTKEEGERLLAFTNNSGPLFIMGTVGISLFGDTKIGFLLLTTHIMASLSVGIIYGIISRIKKHHMIENNIKKDYENHSIATTCSFSNLGEILGKSIMNSIQTILMIGGFVVIFSVIISILNQSHILDSIRIAFTPIFEFFHIDSSFIKPMTTGMIELTNGVKMVSSIPQKIISINIIMCAFLLGFGGISVLLQVLSITSKSDLSIKPYLFGKLLQGILAALYTYFALYQFSFFNLDISIPTSSVVGGSSTNSPFSIILLLALLFLFTLGYFLYKGRSTLFMKHKQSAK